MDCVYQAYVENMKYLKESVYPHEYYYWKFLKWYTHGPKPQYTFGMCAPWIISRLTRFHKFHISICYILYNLNSYREIAKKEYFKYYPRMEKSISFLASRGYFSDKLLGNPSIYLLLNQQHAIFSQGLPEKGFPIMEIHIHDEFKRLKEY